MENVRISFEVPYTGGIPVKELTDRARRFVMELVYPNKTKSSDVENSAVTSWALSPHTNEEIADELDKRWNNYMQHPESAIPHDKVMEEIKARL
ncbi:MAG: hypothetical protein K5650_04255 [Bacteroidales bacterium]|nr:hypothetical protein [Bacteroidales bacterium]